tara:strand:- start:1284 stop:1445 length:162 start_codon:yes stop_codon:yes gene_type:complete
MCNSNTESKKFFKAVKKAYDKLQQDPKSLFLERKRREIWDVANRDGITSSTSE